MQVSDFTILLLGFDYVELKYTPRERACLSLSIYTVILEIYRTIADLKILTQYGTHYPFVSTDLILASYRK